MICDHCSAEADAAQCNTDAHRQLRRINKQRRRQRQHLVGHAGCKGCDCQHQPIGTLKGAADG